MKSKPIVCRWMDVVVPDLSSGEIFKALVPVPPYDKLAAKQFGNENGTEHVVARIEARNMRFHSKYFAMVHEYYENLPEQLAARWESSEHMRHYILIHETDWFLETEGKVGQFIRTSAPYVWIYPHKETGKIIMRRARSQALDEMTKEEFEASAKDVLDVLAGITGIPVSDMSKNAGKHA